MPKYLIPSTWDAASEQVDDMLDHLARQFNDLTAADQLGARDAARPTNSMARTDFEDEHVGYAYRRGYRAYSEHLSSASFLKERYCAVPEGHPDYSRVLWKVAVNQDKTALGYWEWVRQQLQEQFE